MHTELRWVIARRSGTTRSASWSSPEPGRGFCAGADTAALEGHAERGGYDPGTPDDLAEPAAGVGPAFQPDFAWLLGLETVTIAAVNGPAAGVGLALAAGAICGSCAADAKLTTSHGRLGLPAEFGLSWLLPRLIGLGQRERSPALEPGRPGSRGRSVGPGEPGDRRSRRRRAPRAEYARTLVEQVAGVARDDQAADRDRSAPRRSLGSVAEAHGSWTG